MESLINKTARIGGILYLLIIIAGVLGGMVRSQLVLPDDLTATAKNLLASESLWRASIAGDLIMHICDIPLILILYILLRPVNRNLALLAVLFNVVQTIVLVVNKLNLVTALFPLGGALYLNAFQPQQLHVMAYLAIKAHGYGLGVGLIFFGIECLIVGYLIVRSGYLPKILGVLMQIAGLCYLTNSFVLLLAPAVSDMIFPAILIPAFIAELSLALWLLLKGVNTLKWEERNGLRAYSGFFAGA
ncbi:MAG TPA: DUF4386 domain-containing protein [Saprospiraceae bacterium]|nr:DUF4386 domain-containing protein [Saprospiraceae bacterium]HPI05176.1 DUF4386 domain-containing protein [Saprospiraceae bacterium]